MSACARPAVFGGCYAASAYFITQGEAQRGFRFALGNSAALAVAMGYRFVKSKKFMPAGMFTVSAARSYRAPATPPKHVTPFLLLYALLLVCCAGMMAVMGTAGAVYYGMKYSEYME